MAAEDTYSGMTKVSRPVHGPRPIASLVPAITRTALHRAAPGVGQLVEAWVGIVGPALGETTLPRRLAQGTLTIGCSGPVAMELQHLSIELLGRINQYLGSQQVQRLRFMQTAAARSVPQPKPRRVQEVSGGVPEAVAALPEGPLRSALAALGQAVRAESASRLESQPRTRY